MKNFFQKNGIMMLAAVTVVAVLLCVASALSSQTGFLQNAADCGVDAFIISDLGALTIAKQAAPQVAFVFLGPLTNEPPASAGSRARMRGGREFKM